MTAACSAASKAACNSREHFMSLTPGESPPWRSLCYRRSLGGSFQVMGNRLSKIYTRTGDEGSTGLGDGSRVSKESLRVEAYGSVDEANSAVGLVLAVPTLPEAVKGCLTAGQ